MLSNRPDAARIRANVTGFDEQQNAKPGLQQIMKLVLLKLTLEILTM